MHEVGLMMQTLEMASSLARRQGAKTIHRIVLRVGSYSGVDAEALRFAFEAASVGTPAADADLVIEEVPVRCWCSQCREEFDPGGPLFACPTCGIIALEMRRGAELELATLEVS